MRLRMMLSLPVFMVCLAAVYGFTTRQNTGQRVHLEISIPPTPELRLLLPRSTRISVSALEMSRDSTSNALQLTGEAEIRISLGSNPATVLRADQAVLNLNSGEIQTFGDVRLTVEK